MSSFILIAGFVLAGYGFKLTRPSFISIETLSVWLNRYVIFICLPAVIFKNIPSVTFHWSMLLPTAFPWLMIVVSVVTVFVLAKIYSWDKTIVGCLLMVCCFGNTSFFGLAMVQSFYSDKGLPYAIFLDVGGSFLSLAIIGNIIIAIFSANQSVRLVDITKKVLFFPPLIAMALVFIFTDRISSENINWLWGAISLTLVPVTMFILGMNLSLKVDEHYRQPLFWAITIKTLCLPLVALIISVLFFSDSDALLIKVSIFELAMPAMVTAGILAIQAGLAAPLAANAVGIGLLSSCITLPAWFWFLGQII